MMVFIRVDSSEISFILCGHGCIEQIYDYSSKSILEPVMTVEVSYPCEFESRVMPLLMERNFEIDTHETDYIVMYSTVLMDI